MFDGTPCIGQTLLGRLVGQQHQVVTPGYLSNSLLDDCRLAREKPFMVGKALRRS